MRSHIVKSTLGMLLAVALALTPVVGRAGSLSFRTPGVSGDTSSDGAIITVGLLATVCVVMLLLGLKADYENVFTRNDSTPLPTAAAEPDPETVREIIRRFEPGIAHSIAQADPQEPGLALAWQIRF